MNKIRSLEFSRNFNVNNFTKKNIYVPFSLTLKNLNRATGGGVIESTKNATFTNRECLSDYLELKDELLTLRK